MGSILVFFQSHTLFPACSDYFVGLVHYGMYETGAEPTDIGVAFIPTPEMMRNLFAQLEQAYRFDVRDAALALGLSVDAVGLDDHSVLHCPAESRENLLLFLEEAYVDSTKHKHDRHYPVYRSLKFAERWKALYKAGTLLFLGVIVLGLSLALMLVIFRFFNPHSLRHQPQPPVEPPPRPPVHM